MMLTAVSTESFVIASVIEDLSHKLLLFCILTQASKQNHKAADQQAQKHQ